MGQLHIRSTGWSRKYYVFLIRSHEKHLHFEERCQGQPGKHMNPVYIHLISIYGVVDIEIILLISSVRYWQ